jgi:hypothetical protein
MSEDRARPATPTTLEANVHNFLGQNRIAAVGALRNNSHLAAKLIYQRREDRFDRRASARELP